MPADDRDPLPRHLDIPADAGRPEPRAALSELRSAAFERLDASAVVLDDSGVIVDSNEAWRLFAHLNGGRPASTGVGVNYLDVCDSAAQDGDISASVVAAGLREIIAGDRTRFECEYPCDSPTESRWTRLQASSAPVARGTGAIVLHLDITAAKLRQLQLEHQVERDALTGLPDRSAARRRLDELSAAGGPNESVAVMVVDLDGFKAVNDTYGHHVGDELLAKVASRLHRAVRDGDLVCRFGGDEFVVVCAEIEVDDATSISDRIGTVMRESFQIGADLIEIAASVGCATGTPGCTADSLLREADAAMCAEKAHLPRRRARDLQETDTADRRTGSGSPQKISGFSDVVPVHNSPQPRLTDQLPVALPQLATALGIGLIITDADRQVETWNKAAADLCGWTASEAIGQSLGRPIGLSSADSSGRTVRFDSARQPDTTGTHHRPIPQPLTEARLAAVVHRSTDVAMFFAGDGTIAWVSPASAAIFGIAPDALIGMCGFDLIHPEDRARVLGEFAKGLTDSGGSVRVEFRLNDPGKEVRWVEEIVTDLTGDPDVGFVVGNLRDVTNRKQAEDTLTRLALVDELTGLPNKNALLGAIRECELSIDASQMLGLVLFDIDDFCDVNDTLGHDSGDAFLVEMAQRVRTAVPPGALVARFGGDQFAVFSPLVTCEQECEEIAQQVQASLAFPLEIEGHELTASATSGIALAAADHAQELIRDADAALYHARRTARGRSMIFRPEIAEEATTRLRRSSDLRLAINRREIVPFYQPVIELTSGRVVGVEALARWNHSTCGLVPPDEFIPLAEATGLIAQLGQQLLELACAEAVEWLRAGRRLQVSVNASGIQLMDPRFVPMIDAALAATGLRDEQLTIEITETAAVHDPTAAGIALKSLRDRNILLSLDDFGTGYSPLTALRDLPVGAIKLDRTFVAGLGCPAGDNLAAGILQLGFATDKFVVAEGIETKAQAEQLQALGCHFGQGYLWSPAVAGTDVLATIEHIERSRD